MSKKKKKKLYSLIINRMSHLRNRTKSQNIETLYMEELIGD